MAPYFFMVKNPNGTLLIHRVNNVPFGTVAPYFSISSPNGQLSASDKFGPFGSRMQVELVKQK